MDLQTLKAARQFYADQVEHVDQQIAALLESVKNCRHAGQKPYQDPDGVLRCSCCDGVFLR